MFQILVERSAEKDLKRIASEIRPKLADAIRSLAEDPRPPGCRKLVGSENDWRIRVGNYRVIYEIADEIRIVRVTRIRHRKDSYRSSSQKLFRVASASRTRLLQRRLASFFHPSKSDVQPSAAASQVPAVRFKLKPEKFHPRIPLTLNYLANSSHLSKPRSHYSLDSLSGSSKTPWSWVEQFILRLPPYPQSPPTEHCYVHTLQV